MEANKKLTQPALWGIRKDGFKWLGGFFFNNRLAAVRCANEFSVSDPRHTYCAVVWRKAVR